MLRAKFFSNMNVNAFRDWYYKFYYIKFYKFMYLQSQKINLKKENWLALFTPPKKKKKAPN